MRPCAAVPARSGNSTTAAPFREGTYDARSASPSSVVSVTSRAARPSCSGSAVPRGRWVATIAIETGSTIQTMRTAARTPIARRRATHLPSRRRLCQRRRNPEATSTSPAAPSSRPVMVSARMRPSAASTAAMPAPTSDHTPKASAVAATTPGRARSTSTAASPRIASGTTVGTTWSSQRVPASGAANPSTTTYRAIAARARSATRRARGEAVPMRSA